MRMHRRILLSLILPAALLSTLAACGGGGGGSVTVDGKSVAIADLPGEKATADAETTASGLQTIVLKEGDGPQAAVGQTAKVIYAGYLLDGTEFDATGEGGEPYPVVLGAGSVIDGWEEALVLMKAGEKRKLIIPPALGYKEAGYPPVIPANATLVFDVELVSVE